MLKFEWDKYKNEKNIRERNLDFSNAVEMFDGPMLIRLDSRSDYDEERYLAFGLVHGRLMAVVYTYRGPDTVRIISFRRANYREQAQFQDQI